MVWKKTKIMIRRIEYAFINMRIYYPKILINKFKNENWKFDKLLIVKDIKYLKCKWICYAIDILNFFAGNYNYEAIFKFCNMFHILLRISMFNTAKINKYHVPYDKLISNIYFYRK